VRHRLEYLPTAYLQTTWSTLVGVAYLLQVGHNTCVRTAIWGKICVEHPRPGWNEA
jgi:hypothetical protein